MREKMNKQHKNWYKKQKTAFFIFASFTILFIFTGRKLNFGSTAESRYNIFSIEFEYFGMDAALIEKIITIPLEEKINSTANLSEMRSVTENGKATFTMWFPKSTDIKKTYMTLRNFTENLYRQLPDAVQKPRIYSAKIDSKPVFSFAIFSKNNSSQLREFAEVELKKSFESIPGVATVIISGGHLNEVNVKIDSESTAEKHLNPQIFAQLVQDANTIYSGSELHEKNNTINVQFDTKLKSLEEIKKIPVKVKEQYVNLGSLAKISFSEKKQSEHVRINGKNAIYIQVIASSDGNSIKLARECRKVLARQNIPQENYKILSDLGKTQEALLKQIAKAFLQSFFCTILIIPLFYADIYSIAFILLSIPFTILWTICQLSAAGLFIDQNCIAGLTISLGLITDPFLVIAEKADYSTSISDFHDKIHHIFPALLVSSITTFLALIPLYNTDHIIQGIKNLTITTALMIFNSLILSIVFFPCFCKAQKKVCLFSPVFYGSLQKIYSYIPNQLFSKLQKYKKNIHTIYFFLCIIPFFLISFINKNIKFEEETDMLFASIEYPAEYRADIIDSEVQKISEKLEKVNGIKFIKTECHAGNAEIAIGFLPEKIKLSSLAKELKELEYLTNNGNIFISNIFSQNHSKKQNVQSIEISITGDDSKVCKDLAMKNLGIIQQYVKTIQAVLNFKEAPDEIIFSVNQISAAKNKTTTWNIAQNLHWLLSAPVVDKWLKTGSEFDIRISAENLEQANMKELKNIHIQTNSGNIKLEALGKIVQNKSTGKIYHLNGRRCAFFTVKTAEKSMQQSMENIKHALESFSYPQGYSFHISRELKELNEANNKLVLLVTATILMIFIFLTACTEQIKKTLTILSIIPASMILPLTLRVIINGTLHPAEIMGIIISAGTSINNAIYLSDNPARNIRQTMKNHIKSISATSLTTILGTLPLLLSGINGLPKDLAFFILFSTINSMIISLAVFPIILSKT